ncbi:hypothetical protein ACHAW5_006129 [Stephanodiscus triporus]|uniref:RmlD-like substrate binding domain-containing protein n=1 Tax=Stephanodiscus triporus TaxID=2934178 RepID=A0ABD3MCR8_9STRA
MDSKPPSSSDEHSKPPSWEGWSEDAGLSFGLELQSPYAEYLVDGTKTIETRSYPVPAGLMRRRIDVLRSDGGVDGVSSVPDMTALSALGDESNHNSPSSSSSSLVRVGWCTFVRSFRYVSRRLGHTRLRVEHYHEHFPPPAGNDDDDIDDPPREVCLEGLDLLNFEATTDLLDRHRPDVIVHCAAERRPDYFERAPVESMRLNVEATRHLARECARLGMEKSDGGEGGSAGPYLIYVSTEYVFDGGSESGVYPPYRPGSATNPLNEYGRSKLEGERVVREILNDPTTTTTTSRGVAEGGGENATVIGRGGRGIIVRVPLLYGEDCRDLGESPALETMEAFLPPTAAAAAAVARTPTTKKTIDDWALRFPTSAEDVARVLKVVIDRILEGDFRSADCPPSCPPGDTYHVSSPHGITKYELMRLQARAMNIPTSEVDERTVGDSSGPPKDSAPRPRCTQLDCGETWTALGSNGVDLTHEFVSLECGMKRALGGFPERFARM